MTTHENDGGRRLRFRGEIDEEDVQVTPPSSPTRFSMSQSDEIRLLKLELEELEMYKTRCDVLEEKLATVTKEKAGLIDRLEEETRKKSGIRTTNALGPRLDSGDFKTIIENHKYKALKQETLFPDSTEPYLILTKTGVGYLKEAGINVNKNGVKCKERTVVAPISAKISKAAQRLDNHLINLLEPFFTEPKKSESKKLRNPANYTEKANLYGYRGEREHFGSLATQLKDESDNVKNNLLYLNAFNVVKSVLDSKTSVTNDLY